MQLSVSTEREEIQPSSFDDTEIITCEKKHHWTKSIEYAYPTLRSWLLAKNAKMMLHCNRMS